MASFSVKKYTRQHKTPAIPAYAPALRIMLAGQQSEENGNSVEYEDQDFP